MIGVFDSGHGGLTVLGALIARLPERAFVYLGDHGHAPYGERSPTEIAELTVANVERLFGEGCRLVLLACNTAAAIALRPLQREWLPGAYPGRRVLGVFVPMVEAVTAVPWQLQEAPPGAPREPALVGVFATRRTVENGAYAREIALRAPAIEVVQQACPGLVRQIEADAAPEVLEAAIAGHVAALLARLDGRAPDSVILGCTHFPLVAEAFTRALPTGVSVHSQPALVAESLAAYLDRHPEFDDAAPEHRSARQDTRFLTTGDPAKAGDLARRFFGAGLDFEGI